MTFEKAETPPRYRYPDSRLDWNAKTERWEFDGKPFAGEILWCAGWHDDLKVHDPWWCMWRTQQEYLSRVSKGKQE